MQSRVVHATTRLATLLGSQALVFCPQLGRKAAKEGEISFTDL